MTEADAGEVESLRPGLFRRFAERYLHLGDRVADIGCGPGRATLCLLNRACTVTAVDLTRGRGPGAGFVQASNLGLPFFSGAFSAVVADGVIHHTPDACQAFAENVRILGKGGHLYLGVYKRRRYYYYYVYYLAHLVKSRGKRTWRGANNFFYDYIITPRATFHTREEVEGWGRRNGLELLEYDPDVGNVHTFVFRKA